jgi:hypothetical protein
VNSARGLAALLAVAAAAGAWSSDALAGYGVQPSNGAVTAADPSFVVVLDRFDSLASVRVSSSPQFTSSGAPIGADVGFCQPATPFGEQDKYTCKPAGYAPGFTTRLPPGTYYWWLTFWRDNPSEGPSSAGTRISGPFAFTVPPPPPAADVGLVAPANGATRSVPLQLTVRAPAGASVRIHASTSPERASDGRPVGADAVACAGSAADDGSYRCALGNVVAGRTYYWWAVVEAGDGQLTYGPWTLTVAASPSGGTGTTAPTRTRFAAPNLPSVSRWVGASAKQTRLTTAVYQYSKWLGFPRRVAVACWSDRDWPTVTEMAEHHNLLGFWAPTQPRWLHLSPRVCRAMETLLTNRPHYPNAIIANALDTVAHEMIHAMGIGNEAKTECLAMQTADVVGWYLGVRGQYLRGLSRLFLAANKQRPPQYRDAYRCREGGPWDLDPGHPSPPWHP